MGKKKFGMLAVILVLLIIVSGCTGEGKALESSLSLEQRLITKLVESEQIYNNTIEYQNTIENEIISKFLSNQKSGEDYVVVDPVFQSGVFRNVGLNTAKIQVQVEDYIGYFKRAGYDISKLFYQFIEIDNSNTKMNVKSSIDEGYYINHDGNFEKNLYSFLKDEEIENLWDWMRKVSPHFRGYLSISRPAYDPDTGCVLIFSSFECGELCGYGRLHLLKYDGELSEITYLEIWNS